MVVVDYVSLSEENLGAVHVLSNLNLQFDHVAPDIFRHKTLEDPDFDSSMAIVSVSGGKPCGCMIAVCRETDDGISAGIKLFAVDESKVAGAKVSRIFWQFRKEL